jgi:hypothetical protein
MEDRSTKGGFVHGYFYYPMNVLAVGFAAVLATDVLQAHSNLSDSLCPQQAALLLCCLFGTKWDSCKSFLFVEI